jgi:NosR/NirI family nitrous oxide reductase transcriptional regulator
MLSTDITDTPAYSGKPVVTLIGMDTTGHFVGVKVLKHSEPILLLGIPESALLNFNNQYLGKSVAQNIEVGQSRPEENILGLDAISGRHGDGDCTEPGHDDLGHQHCAPGWHSGAHRARCRPVCRNPQILHVGTNWSSRVSVQRLLVKTEQVGLDPSSDPFIELWFGDLNHPDVGRSVLGELGFQQPA